MRVKLELKDKSKETENVLQYLDACSDKINTMVDIENLVYLSAVGGCEILIEDKGEDNGR